MQKLLYLTNIPTPYRIKRFNDLSRLLLKKNIELEVLFMAPIEPNRNWVIDYSTIHFTYNVWPGIHPSCGEMYAHLNPSLLWRLRKKDYQYIIVGGMSCPTLWFAKMFIPKGVKKIMSIETNLKGNTTKTGLKKFVKSHLIKGYDAYQVTGEPQQEYIEYFSGRKQKYVILPNLIDNNIFHNVPIGERLSNDISIIIPARVVSYKIPDTFLDACKGLSGIKFYIVGTGLKEYEEYIASRIKNEHLNIEMLGFVQQEEMAKLYNKSDYYCLPTQEDPSPLSPIEAIACGVPILVSTLIGNLDEVLVEGENGFSFDPYNTEHMAILFNSLKNVSKDNYKQMSEKALNRYNEIFDNEKCLTSYVEQIINI